MSGTLAIASKSRRSLDDKYRQTASGVNQLQRLRIYAEGKTMSQEKTNKPSQDGATPESPTQAKPAVATDRLELLLELLLSSKQDELEKQAAQKARQKALAEQREKSQAQNA